MVSTNKDNVLVVLSLSGGNDGLNTVIPYNDGYYRDFRPNLGVAADAVIDLNGEIGMHPTMLPLKKYWDEGKLAVFLGIGYANPSYSHFRSMDIWHTCEPDTIGTEGWLGQVIHELDPKNEGQGPHRRQLRPWPSPRSRQGRRAGSIGRQPRDLRLAHRYRRR